MAATVATPERIAPSSQTMDAADLSPSTPPSEAANSDSPAVDLPEQPVRNSFLSRISSFQSLGALRTDDYRLLFPLLSEEVLLEDFNCALQENILLQGHMYLFEHYICFYSNIFGFETKKIIPLQDVISVRRAKTAAIFPNAIEIVVGEKKHFFASFFSRDEAFTRIVDVWSQCGTGIKVTLDGQDSRSETRSQLNGATLVENGSSSDSQVSDLDSDERTIEVPGSEETKLPADNVDANAVVAAPEALDVEDKPVAFADIEPSTSFRSNKWTKVTGDAPEIPKCYTKVLESKFPINAQQFFNLFFSDDAIGFVESYHKICGDKDFRCTSWSQHDKIGCRREKTFQHPLNMYLGPKSSGCKEVQKFQVYRNSHLVIETSQEVSDVPYADYFTVEGFWDVQKDGGSSEECCILQVYITVAFSKNTMWKGKIQQSTVEECRTTFGTWIRLAHELLQQKNIEKSEEVRTVIVPNNSEVNKGVDGNSEICEGQLERLPSDAERMRISDRVVNSSRREPTGNPLRGDLHESTTSVSILRAVALKFFSFLRSQSNLGLVVIAFSVILLLMQLSIVVLLSRPQQVYVIPQMETSTSLGLDVHRAAETIYIEKKITLLMDDMAFVEAQLERMRQEQILLKAQLEDVELRKRKKT